MKLINNVISFSLRNTLLILLGALLIILGGIYTSKKMDIDVFPDLTAPTVVIMTDAEGMAAIEVERLVSYPIETAVNGSANVRRVRSTSMPGVSFVWVEFDWGADVYKARQTVSEKLVTITDQLPEGLTPVMAPQSSVMGEILFVGMQADTTSMQDVRTLAEWVVKPAILSTGGVSQVSILGGDLKQYQIIADPVRMAARGISLAQIEEVGRSFSANSTGGVVRDYGNEYALRGIARTSDPEELGRSVVGMDGERPVMLSEVADVVVGNAQKMGHATIDASPAVIISISKQPNVNTLQVTEKIEETLASLKKSLPADVRLDTKIFRQADFIETSVSNVGDALIEGAIFVIIILFFFLNSFRTTLISLVAIPLSLLATIIVLQLLGMNINTMTLGGMCIAIGSLVDDAIIDVENVYKRLRQNHQLPPSERRSVFDVVFEASKEIRSSILNATFIIIVAFIPLFFLSGMEGRMLKPLGTAYIISLFMSLVVAMTVTPLLSKLLLSQEKYLLKKEKEGVVVRKLNGWYSKALAWTLAHKKVAVSVTGLLFGLALALCLTFGGGFLPDFNEGSATISAVAEPGVSLDVNNELGMLMERELMKIPEVKGTARRSGREDLDAHSQMTNSAEIDVRLEFKDRSRQEVFDDMRQKLANVPGIVATIGQPLGHRIDHILSGTRANIAIKLFGTDLGGMWRVGNEIKEEIEKISGVVDVSVEQQTSTPQIQIRANRAALARHGITIADFNNFVEAAFSGERIGEIYEDQRSFDVILRLKEDYRNSVEGLRSALIDTPTGGKVPLGEVAEIVSASGPNSVSRENTQRKLVVSANVSGRDLNGAVREIREKVDANIGLPEGYRIEYGGQFENATEASRTLVWATLGALVVIFLLLYGEFASLSLALIILISLPFALIGGVFAIFFTSGIVSIPSIIGFITLFGVAVRNGILMVSRYKKLREEGHGLRETVVTGSIDRLNPILMTALTSALALVPLVIASDKSGNEIQSPMAVVILGGLLTSTLLNLFLMPVIFEWYVRRKERKAAA